MKFKTDNEFFVHKERADGTRDLFFGMPGDSSHNHAVIDPNGNLKFLREDGHIKADNGLPPSGIFGDLG